MYPVETGEGVCSDWLRKNSTSAQEVRLAVLYNACRALVCQCASMGMVDRAHVWEPLRMISVICWVETKSSLQCTPG